MRLNDEPNVDWLDGYEWPEAVKVTITGRDQFGATLIEDLAFLPHMRQIGASISKRCSNWESEEAERQAWNATP